MAIRDDDTAWIEKWLANQHKSPAQLRTERETQKAAEHAAYLVYCARNRLKPEA